MIRLQSVTPPILVSELARAFSEGAEVTLAEARKIVAAVHRDDPVLSPTLSLREVRKSALVAVRAACEVPSLEIASAEASAIDPFVKYVLRTHDSHLVETVRIPLEHPGRFSACVSSQIGCALACAFCATGRMGLVRNLETWEIVEQVRIVRRALRAMPADANGVRPRVHGVVFQGMGEPLANLDRVLDAISVMTDPSALAIDARAITVCTSGNPNGIARLAKEAPKVRLGVSISSARRDVRRRLMPIEGAHPLDLVIDAAVDHAKKTGLAPMFAVTPLAGVNDTEEDARALTALASDFAARAGVRPRVSIVPYNAIGEGPRGEQDLFSRADADREATFFSALSDGGVRPHKRYSGGSDVGAACGQLAARSPVSST